MRTIEKLEQDIQVLIQYSKTKIEQRDWHAVADAMMDIRELEAKKQITEQLSLEIEELKYQLNNSEMFHCPHFLTNDSGGISCHKDFQSEIAKRDELIREAMPFIKDDNYKYYNNVVHWLQKAREILG